MWCLVQLSNHTSFISLQSFSLTSCSCLVISYWEWLCKSVNSNRGSCCHFLGFPHRFRNCVSLRVFISVHCFITFSIVSRGCGPVQLQCSVSSCGFKMVMLTLNPMNGTTLDYKLPDTILMKTKHVKYSLRVVVVIIIIIQRNSVDKLLIKGS